MALRISRCVRERSRLASVAVPPNPTRGCPVTAIVLQIPEDLKLLCAPIEALLRAVASRVERAR